MPLDAPVGHGTYVVNHLVSNQEVGGSIPRGVLDGQGFTSNREALFSACGRSSRLSRLSGSHKIDGEFVEEDEGKTRGKVEESQATDQLSLYDLSYL
jgi:hypothetical protein